MLSEKNKSERGNQDMTGEDAQRESLSWSVTSSWFHREHCGGEWPESWQTLREEGRLLGVWREWLQKGLQAPQKAMQGKMKQHEGKITFSTEEKASAS